MEKGKVIQMPNASASHTREWTAVADDGCRWILDLPGGPLAVLPCDVCKAPVEIYIDANLRHHKVECPECGKHTPEVMGGELIDVLKLWNEMVDGR